VPGHAFCRHDVDQDQRRGGQVSDRGTNGPLHRRNHGAGGLRVIDVSNKRRPREIGRYINQALPGKPQAYNNVILEGSRAYVALDYCGLEILDISDPKNIRQLGWWNPWECGRNSNL
jgi:hypothetical protein